MAILTKPKLIVFISMSKLKHAFEPDPKPKKNPAETKKNHQNAKMEST